MIREAINQRMESLGISQVGLCRELELTPQNVNAFLHGKRPLPYGNMVSILSYLRLGVGMANSNLATTSAENIPAAIQQRIKTKGMSVIATSALTGVNAGTISSFINGKRTVSLGVLEVLLKKLMLDIKPLRKSTQTDYKQC